MNEVDNINIWVRVNVNTKSCLDGTNDFVKELKEFCPVQYRKEYYPNACEGTEIIIKFFTDSVLGSFFSNVVFSGIAFDITKFFFKKTWDVVIKFIERNRAIDIQELEFVFNDITISISDVNKNNYLNLALLFQQLHKHIKVMEVDGIKDICKIRLPVVGEEIANLNIPEEVKDYYNYTDCVWYVIYDFGCNSCYYNSNAEKIISF